jgi:hypothetical protein
LRRWDLREGRARRPGSPAHSLWKKLEGVVAPQHGGVREGKPSRYGPDIDARLGSSRARIRRAIVLRRTPRNAELVDRIRFTLSGFKVHDRQTFLRGPGESHSDVILAWRTAGRATVRAKRARIPFNQEPLIKLHVISQVLLRRRKCSKQSELWLSVRFSRSRQWALSLRQVTARGPILIHIRPSSAPGTRATRARIVRARARSGCTIITAPRSKGVSATRFRLAGRSRPSD